MQEEYSIEKTHEYYCQQAGFIYKNWYWVSYKDPYYPCGCQCHIPGINIRHIVACCHDKSFDFKWLQLNGVFKENNQCGLYMKFSCPHPYAHSFVDKNRELVYKIYINNRVGWVIN